HETLGCDLCGRHLHEESSYKIHPSSGEVLEACCPVAGYATKRAPATWSEARSPIYPSGEFISTSRAFYVAGSNIHICAPDRTQRNRAGDIYHLLWDRCMPSLLAFTAEEEAESFRRQHGGEILTYAEALASNL
ncbi:MAG: hypothetical protein QF619_13015, partial [Candidatus Binatia bacterium]|nr:hypothetical protein [Candidatus Binatia bacterium]